MSRRATKYRELLVDDGAEKTLLIPGTPEFNSVAIQIVGSTGVGNTINLEGSVDGLNFSPIGLLTSTAQGALTGDGLLFYSSVAPLVMRVRYTLTAVVGDVHLFVQLAKQVRASVISY